MAVKDTVFTLNNGKKIPALALGTWQAGPGEVAKIVEYALTTAGYRHIDCAFAYGNEEEVGRGIAAAIKSGKVTREEIFVTTKVWSTWHDRISEALDVSLKNLGLEYVDMLLIHWPIALNPHGNHPIAPTTPDGGRDVDPNGSYIKMWKDLETIYKTTKKVQAIGVCNCSIPYLEELLKEAEIVPAVNQVELHPQLPQLELVKYCKEKGIICEAFSPLGSSGGPLLKLPTVQKIAEKYKTSPGGILLSYHISGGKVVLAKTVNPARATANSNDLVELSEEDLATLDKVAETEGIRRTSKPKWGVDLKFDDWTDWHPAHWK
ncbi:NADP-dependent oxidoreductase domain-containing protein [Myxozyma melibiosi]|uniref:NADP-dependent oxidoreductase domain-containing protein n=1 Tax=Myxozyma melibiosi TaxID=54550 RepID=A0ABR1EXV9_9ASCO